MPVRTERSDKWVRAFVGETTVVDSRAPLLYYEEAFPVPGYAFAKADVRTDLLRPAKGEPPRALFHPAQGPGVAMVRPQGGRPSDPSCCLDPGRA